LIRGAEDEHMWADSYDRDLNQVLALISEISMAIADEIEVTVKQREAEARTEESLVDFAVHEQVLQGDHFFHRFNFEESLRHYQQAVDMDEDYAPAHAGVAASYLVSGFFGSMPGSECIPKAREGALKAISLDNNSAAGYSTLGFIQLYYDWDWDLAKTNLLRALELAPNDAGARHAYADYLMVMGDLQGSLKQVEIGYLYDPFSPMARVVLDGHRLFARQYDKVIEEARKDIAQYPDSAADLVMYREALWHKGLYEEALAAYRKTWGEDEELLAAIDTGFSASGYTGAVGSLARALAERDAEFRDYVTIAELYAMAGEPRAAMESLEKAYALRQPRILHIRVQPGFDELRSDPAFQDLLDRIGFPDVAPG
ncbi:MAG: hypothetical protein QNI99_20100, partial [Woeseiaceae bacterium]|nr:hypothetical protein [Woeseiaceae bacterium]